MQTGGETEGVQAKKTQAVEKRRSPRSLIVVLVIAGLAAAGAGIRGCANVQRRSVVAKAPKVKLVEPAAYRGGVPVCESNVVVELDGPAAFVEVVPDEVYRAGRSGFWADALAGRLLGGQVLFLSKDEKLVSDWKSATGYKNPAPFSLGGKRLVIQWGQHRESSDGKYCIRAARQTNTIAYKENLDRMLYSLVGRLVDGMCGSLVLRKGPGGAYGPDEFHVFALGEFRPFIMSGTGPRTEENR